MNIYHYLILMLWAKNNNIPFPSPHKLVVFKGEGLY